MFSKILGGIQTFFDYMCVAFSKAVTVAVVTLMAFCILGVVIGIPVKSFLDWKSDLEQKSFSDGYNAAARDAVSGVEKFYDEVRYRLPDTENKYIPNEFVFKQLRAVVTENLSDDISLTLRMSQDDRTVSKYVRAVVDDSELKFEAIKVANDMLQENELSKAIWQFVVEGREPPSCPPYGWLQNPDVRQYGTQEVYEVQKRDIGVLQLWNQGFSEVALYLVIRNAENGGIKDEDLVRLYRQELKEEFLYIAENMEHYLTTHQYWQAGWFQRKREALRRAGEVQEWYPGIQILSSIEGELARIREVSLAIDEATK